jgi:hypothetical protein
LLKPFRQQNKQERVSNALKENNHHAHETIVLLPFSLLQGYSGENALDFCTNGCYQGAFDQIVRQSTQYGRIQRFTYLRMTDQLLSGSNWNMFTRFVATMHSS